MIAPGSHARDAEAETWHRLDVRRWPALARTRLTVTGVLDMAAVAAIDRAVRAANGGAHELTLDLTHISTITPSARDQLLARDFRSREATP